jgi:cell division protein FtsB
MTNKQTLWSIFIVAVLVSLVLLAVIIKVNSQLEQSKRATVELQRQIDKIKAEDQELKQQIAKLTNANVAINKDIDVTQELQRKQAQAILELKKAKKR